jgi:hypothetical protein
MSKHFRRKWLLSYNQESNEKLIRYVVLDNQNINEKVFQ